jgi:hypothetical protein
MGEGMWTMRNLRTMVRDSDAARNVKPEQVQSMLEDPKCFKAAKIARNVAADILDISMDVQKNIDSSRQKEKVAEQEMTQPEINPLQIPGGTL